MDRYFDPIYYVLSAAILLALSYSAYAGVRFRRGASLRVFRIRGLGITLTAIGVAIALAGGILADSFLKDAAYFQQARFAAYYAGFALITLGMNATLRATQAPSPVPGPLSSSRLTAFILWAAFLGSAAVATVYLSYPSTFILNSRGDQVQRVVYWAPMLATTLVGATLLFTTAVALKGRSQRAHLFWMGAFAALVLIGLLRESLIVPSLGDPLADLLVAFVPFTIGSVCLCLAARSLNRNHATEESDF